MIRRLVRTTASVLAVVLLAGCGGSRDDDQDGSPDPDRNPPTSASDQAAPDEPTDRSSVLDQAETARPTPVDVPREVAERATDAASDFTDAIVGALVRPGAPVSDLVAGTAREALLAQAQEYQQSGLRLRGRPEVLSVEVYESTDDRLVLGACIDDSRVRVVDRKGQVVSGSADRPPTLNLLTVDEVDGRWVVVDSSFPADPDC